MAGNLAVDRIILFDGVCNLCNASVHFVIKRDVKGVFRFASLQSGFAQRIPEMAKIAGALKTIVLLKNGSVYLRSDAALEIARDLRGLWPGLYFLKLIPKFVRDGVYDFISRHRYQWFGKTDECWLPSPELNSRFVD
jgi:predicted DCC family thiol-disulfide oxidoreductase YuxK